MKKMPKLNPAIYLEKDFRNILFSRAYKNAGCSLGAMAFEIGYRGRGRNGTVRDMWLGKVSVSTPKIERIAKLAGFSLDDILIHKVAREENVQIENWTEAFTQYKEKALRNNKRNSK